MAEIITLGGKNFQPSTANTGNELLGSVLRGRNMMIRGSDGSFFFECYRGHKNLQEPIPMKQIDGTLSYVAGSTDIVGSGTLFLEQLRFGMKLLVGSQVLVVGNIIDDEHFDSQRAPDQTESGQTAYKMPHLFDINNQRGTLIWGNAIKTDKGNIVAVGEGRLRINGAELAGDSMLVQRRIQIALYQAADKTYRVENLGYSVAPSGVKVDVVSGGSKNMSVGNYSWRFAWANFDTAFGFSNPGEVVKFLDGTTTPIAITSTNQRFRINFTDALLNKPTNADSVVVFRSQYGDASSNINLAAEGSWYLAAQVKISDLESGNLLYIDVLDGELGFEVSFDNDEPPDADWLSFISGDPILISCYGDKTTDNDDGTSPGPFISPGKRGNRDAFPADIAVPLSPPDTIIGFVPGVGRLFLMTRVSLPFASGTGQSDFPVVTTPFWQTGFNSPYGLVLINDFLYAWTAKGATRSIATGDAGDEQFFSAAVEEITKDWNPGYIHAVHDRQNELVVFIYSAAERDADGWWISLALPFYLRHGVFGPLIPLSKPDRDFIVCGAANIGGKLQFIAGGRGGSYTPPSGGSMSEILQFPVAGRYGTDALPIWDIPEAPDAPTPTLVGTNVKKAVFEFSNSDPQYAEMHFVLPTDWTGIISARVLWSTAETAGNMKWSIQTSFTDLSNNNDPDDNAYNAANTVVQAVSANANDEVGAEFSSLTTTGAVAGGPIHIKISRDPSDASDTCSGVVYLSLVEITLRRQV